MNPLISVIMSVYNTNEKWLKESIESILKQSYREFEFIIIIDCPTDNSDTIIQHYANTDERIRIIRNENNIGLTKSLNKGLQMANGKYIARMDADDISLPDRFARQVSYMESHPEVAALGCRCYIEESTETVQYECTENQEVLKIRFLFRNAGLPHPTALIRKSVLDQNGIKYTENIKKSQDYQLWVDLVNYGEIIMLPEILFIYRIHENQVSANKDSQMGFAHQISVCQAEKLLGELTEQEKIIHSTFFELLNSEKKFDKSYLKKLLYANKEKNIYDNKFFKREIRYMWCQKAIRQYKINGNPAWLLDIWIFNLIRPSIIRYFIRNKKDKNDYVKEVKQFRREQM